MASFGAVIGLAQAKAQALELNTTSNIKRQKACRFPLMHGGIHAVDPPLNALIKWTKQHIATTWIFSFLEKQQLHIQIDFSYDMP